MYRVEVMPAIEKSLDKITFRCNNSYEAILVRDTVIEMLIFLKDDMKVMQNYTDEVIILKCDENNERYF